MTGHSQYPFKQQFTKMAFFYYQPRSNVDFEIYFRILQRPVDILVSYTTQERRVSRNRNTHPLHSSRLFLFLTSLFTPEWLNNFFYCYNGASNVIQLAFPILFNHSSKICKGWVPGFQNPKNPVCRVYTFTAYPTKYHYFYGVIEPSLRSVDDWR